MLRTAVIHLSPDALREVREGSDSPAELTLELERSKALEGLLSYFCVDPRETVIEVEVSDINFAYDPVSCVTTGHIVVDYQVYCYYGCKDMDGSTESDDVLPFLVDHSTGELRIEVDIPEPRNTYDEY